MAKRFIESGTFRNEFIRSLPAEYKLFYLYLLCECDHCGIWSVEMDVASLRIGLDVNKRDALILFKNKVVEFDNGTKWFIPAFIFFQYGDIVSSYNKIHRAVCARLEKSNLIQFVLNKNEVAEIDNRTESEQLPNSYDSVTKDYQGSIDTPKVKVKDKDKDKVKDTDIRKTDLNEFDLKEQSSPVDIITPPAQRKRSTANEDASNAERKEIIEAYSDWMKARDLPVRIDAADAAAVKKIVAFLSKFETVANGQKSVLDLFKFILNSWSSLTPWLQTQTQLKQINSQLPTIIETIKTKQNGKQSSQNQQQQLANLANALRNSITGSGAM